MGGGRSAVAAAGGDDRPFSWRRLPSGGRVGGAQWGLMVAPPYLGKEVGG